MAQGTGFQRKQAADKAGTAGRSGEPGRAGPCQQHKARTFKIRMKIVSQTAGMTNR